MPGRTPEEAVHAFLDPFRDALGLFKGVAKLAVAPRSMRRGGSYRWSINAEQGVELGSIGTFHASMNFQIVDSVPSEHDEEHQGRFRCSSRGYNYKLQTPRGSDLWRMHWHPDGVSTEAGPHVHLPPDLKRHLPTSRMTLEHALGWLIEFDAPLRVSMDEAKARLAELEAPHLLHRTWSDRPGEPRG